MSARKSIPIALAILLLCLNVALAGVAYPVPIGDSTVTVSYYSNGGEVVYSGDRFFNGTSPSAATALDDSPNIKVFQSANGFGRRLNVSLQYPEVLGEDETLIAHNFFKSDNYAEYFPGISSDDAITFRFEGIQFAEPVLVHEDTALFHVFWDVNQSRLLEHPYHHVHNVHTLTDPFRDTQRFFDADEFMMTPPHQVFGDLAGLLEISGSGTTELTVQATIPYTMLQHLDDMNLYVPKGLPAPHGFLEPFHFHFEYVVSPVPEPAALVLLSAGAMLVVFRRRHK